MARMKLGTSWNENSLFLANASQASYSRVPTQSVAYKKLELGRPIQFGDGSHSSLGDVGFVAATSTALVVAIRGTDDFEDWLRNLDFQKVRAYGGRVHKGFLEGALTIYSAVEQAIDTLDNSKLRRLFVTGHSRGAAIAVLLAAKLLDEKQFAHPKQISVCGFGCPRVGDLDFFDNYPLRDRTRLYINEADPVPLAPLINQDFVHASEQYLINNGKLRLIDLDTTVDSGLHLFRVGLPNIKDHRLDRGYMTNLELLS